MRPEKYFYLFLLSVFLIIVLTFGCSRDADKSSSTSSNSSSSTTPGELIINLGVEPDTIDPNKPSSVYELTIIVQCFDGLIGANPDLSFRPVTATEIPTFENGGISSDGLTYTFKLRHDVTWSDGVKVTARDYVYGIKRMLSPDIASPGAFDLYDIIGAKAYNTAANKDESEKTLLRDAVGVTTLDDYTLQIKLSNPRANFLEKLFRVCPIREDVISKYGNQWTDPGNYIGNGPFILTEWAHRDHITLKANPNYWGVNKPKVSQIVFKMVSDYNVALAAYKNDEIYLVGVPAGNEKAIMADPVLGKETLKYSILCTMGITFNVTKAPFNNVKVRQAFATAIDRISYVNKLHAGVGKPAYSWIPPGSLGYDAALGQEYKFDPAKAKKLLAEAGYSDVHKLPPIKLSHSNVGIDIMDAQFIQGQLKANLGIDIILDPMESKAYMGTINSGNYQAGIYGWVHLPDPDNWLSLLFRTGSGMNTTKYNNPQFDELCIKASQELDYTKRMELWAKAHEIIVRDVPIAFIYYTENLWLLKPYVKGLTTTGVDGAIPGELFYSNITVDK
jgi:oligopeptide transport system substrate-binding protein